MALAFSFDIKLAAPSDPTKLLVDGPGPHVATFNAGATTSESWIRYVSDDADGVIVQIDDANVIAAEGPSPYPSAVVETP